MIKMMAPVVHAKPMLGDNRLVYRAADDKKLKMGGFHAKMAEPRSYMMQGAAEKLK